MVYRALGVLMSHHDVTITFTGFQENAGKWSFELNEHTTSPAGTLNNLLRVFIEENSLQYRIALVTAHSDAKDIILNGASLAAFLQLPVITELEALDIELGGNGEFYRSCAGKLGIAEGDMDDVHKSLCIAFMGILRWREEYNFFSALTGAARNSIGGALWNGQDA